MDVVRKPIFDQTRKVVGYDLIVRPTEDGAVAEGSIDRMSARVITDSLLAVGLDALTAGRRAFITVSRRILLEGMPDVLPASRVVLQLASDIEADAEVIAACRARREAGYALAIDDFVPTPWTEDLVPLATFVKTKAPAVDDALRERFVKVAGGQMPTLIVKDVGSNALFEQLAGSGCKYFEGTFFEEAVVKPGRTAQSHQVIYLRLLRALNNPNLSVAELEDHVKHDAALCLRILRTVNSAGFALRSTVTSIRDALILLGRDTIRRWASLWVLASLNDKAISEVVATATIRARCCEVLGASASDELGSQGFLLGLCSLLDAILERPMADVLADLPIDAETKAALLGTDNEMRRLLDCAIAYENGDWQRAADLARAVGIRPATLQTAYADAIKWSRALDTDRAA
jgi:EAL and modified HD-GYP domain-containing signal transduction protein